MKHTLAIILVVLSSISFGQQLRVTGILAADDLSAKLGQITIHSLPDSSLRKGTYIDSSNFSLLMDRNGGTEFYAKLKLDGYSDTIINFSTSDSIHNLGMIVMSKNLELETFEFVYRQPTFERTMDGIKVNVEGTTLETMDNLFEILKASPKLSSPDDESIEIIGKGVPLILVDRQPILTNDELKAIPAEMVEKIEIITNPSAKYRTQGRGSGVIEVYTKNFRLQGYNMNVSGNGGINTQLKPTGRLGIGLSLKKKKFSMNMYASGNYRSSNSFGSTTTEIFDTTNRTTTSNYTDENQSIWQHFSIKSAYQINDKQKITAGVNGGGSIYKSISESNKMYFEGDELQTTNDKLGSDGFTWLNSSAFLNYTVETDTFNSNFEVNLNYQYKIREGKATFYNDFIDTTGAVFKNDIQNQNRNRPNVTEVRVTYEHVFDTSGWKLSGGGAYSIILNGMRFDQSNLIDDQWVNDPVYSNSYDYIEQNGSAFLETTKNWDKVSLRAGVTAEYTDLNGFSNSLNKQFIDSNYVMLFPSGSIMINPKDNFSMTLRYSSGIDRPSFSNYDPFVRIQDSLNISYGNPYLRPSVYHSTGVSFDFFNAYSLSVDYSYNHRPTSQLTFIDSNFVSNSTPWNSDNDQSLNVYISAPVKTKWMSGWNSLWMTYTMTQFTPEFQRADISYLTFGLWSNLNFYLPGDFTLTNRLHASRWGSENFLGNFRASWSMRLTKKLLDNNLRIFVEVQDIVPPKNKNYNYANNYTSYTEAQYAFTSFRLGIYYKFGRLRSEAQIQESKSNQSGRI
ncbi:outer membrane beta-barrel protein [Paracrocinitomix mangrovi]|uniref:outer membrane beta-barrel protein n=1 Tax=Paracrocinitomix mangrovi TaxID=2862509 RepID=UPI001C8EB263|nr:outer membrane beta-barrel protein [Paracrocinitomix mangrovi]UKN01334.1 outer membrane beta-barrel protein [Paracrocinitomix mangrovi]